MSAGSRQFPPARRVGPGAGAAGFSAHATRLLFPGPIYDARSGPFIALPESLALTTMSPLLYRQFSWHRVCRAFILALTARGPVAGSIPPRDSSRPPAQSPGSIDTTFGGPKAPPVGGDDFVVLSPFEVRSEKDRGYAVAIAFVRYQRKFWRASWSFQLNIQNIFDQDNFRWTRYQSTAVAARPANDRIDAPREIALTFRTSF